MKQHGDIELIDGEIINLVAQKVGSDPTFDANDEGIIIYNTTENVYKYNNGTEWVVFQISLTSSTKLTETLGNNWINPDFSFNPTDFNALDNISGLTTDDSLFDVINQLDTGITDAKTVIQLQGVDLDFVEGDLSNRNIIFYDGVNFIPGTINDLDTVDISFSEISDTNFSTLGNNQIPVYQSSKWVNKRFLFQYQELSGTLNVFTVNHSLGTKFCDVTVIDMSFATPRRIDPSLISKIEYNSNTTLTVTLTTNKPVTIIVVGLAIV